MLRVYEGTTLRKTFGPKSEGWRKLHNEALHDSYSSNTVKVNTSRRTTWSGYVAGWGSTEGHTWIPREKPVGQRQLEKHRHR